MLFANPYDCEKAATEARIWVIQLDKPETVYSFQVAVVDANKITDKGKLEFFVFCTCCFAVNVGLPVSDTSTVANVGRR